MALNPKKSGEFVVKHAKFIKVNQTGIQNLVNEVH